MSEHNGTGIEYPTIELGGKSYVVKFTRGALLYRLSKGGANIADLGGPKSFSASIDVLHAVLGGQFSGTVEELAELVFGEGKIASVAQVIAEALGKVFPPTQVSAAGTADQPAAIVQ